MTFIIVILTIFCACVANLAGASQTLSWAIGTGVGLSAFGFVMWALASDPLRRR